MIVNNSMTPLISSLKTLNFIHVVYLHVHAFILLIFGFCSIAEVPLKENWDGIIKGIYKGQFLTHHFFCCGF